jgi:Thrombospondin type 3 repeat
VAVLSFPPAPARFEGSSMHPRTFCRPSRRRLLRLLLVTVALTLAAAASAQAATITVDQDCIEQGTPITGGGPVSGTITGAPAGVSVFVSTDRYSGQDWTHFGGDYADMDAEGNGTFSYHFLYRTDLPDTVFIKARYFDRDVWDWLVIAEDAVPVCGREPVPDPDSDDDGVLDSVDNCQSTPNAGQENYDLDAQGDACDADDDNDGVNDEGDNCRFTSSPTQRDDDGDGIGDDCDGTFDSSDGKSSGGGGLTTSDGRVNFSSSAKRVDGEMAGNCVVTVGQTKIKCLTVDGYYQSPTNDRAVFFGSATQDGVATRYRIELTDNGEPGTSDRIEITTDDGFVAAGVIGGGNLQVHRGV